MDINDLVATAAMTSAMSKGMFVIIVGTDSNLKSSIADLFKGIHLCTPTISNGYIDHWINAPYCKIIDTGADMTDETLTILSGIQYYQHQAGSLRTRYLFQPETFVVPSSVVVTMNPAQYQRYLKLLTKHYLVQAQTNTELTVTFVDHW